MHQLNPFFEEEKIHLMSQAANDLNLSFVVDRSQGERLVSKLHSSIIRQTGGSPAFGKSWEQLFTVAETPIRDVQPWWLDERDKLLELAAETLNTYVYHLDSVRGAARDLLNLNNVGRILYAVKANDNAEILRALAKEGIDFECVSPGEVQWLEQCVPESFYVNMLATYPQFRGQGAGIGFTDA